MKDPRLEKLADMLVNYSVAVMPGQKVLIECSVQAEPLVKEVYKKVLQAGGYPLVVPRMPGMDELLYTYGSDDQLKHIPPPMAQMLETYDVLINLMSEVNTKSLSRIDPQKMVLRQRAYEPLMKTYLSRAAKKELKWVLTLFPSNAHAQDAEMSLTDYEDFVFNASMPDPDDPVNYWKKISAEQQKIIDWLSGKKKIHIVGPDTDLHLSIEGRTFVNCDCHENVPDGEIFTAPVEDSIEGHVSFSYPAIYNRREVEGVKLWFEKGRVVKASAEKNEDFLLKTLETDEGSKRVGEFAIGTNEGITRFTREILFDEKIGGSFHMALGAGYPESGSVNESAIHWDMICDLRQGGVIMVDDQMLYQNGQFVTTP